MNYYLDFVYKIGLVIIISICIYINLKTDNNLLEKKKFILFFIAEMFNFYVIGNLIHTYNIACVLLPFVGGLALALIIFKDKWIKIIVAYLVSIFIFQMINVIIYSITLLMYTNFFISKKYILLIYNILKVIFICCAVGMCFTFKKIIKNIQEVLNYDFKYLGILSIFITMMLLISMIINRDFFANMLMIRIVMVIVFGIVAVSLLMQSINIEKKVKITFDISKQLEIKNNELRKIKHDYGAQISYLYGLYLLKRWDSLMEAVDNIIETNNSISNCVFLNKKENSKIGEVVHKLLEEGVHIIIEETEDIEIIEVKYKELFPIIKNICEGIMQIMGGECLIKIKTYIETENFIINFESGRFEYNNQKEKSNIKKKLKILLKDVINTVNNNGKMYIRKNDNILQVKIKFPI